jgi:hypothetical protein
MDGIETTGVFPFAFHREMADQILLFLVPLVIFQITGSVGWSGVAFKTTGLIVMLNNLSQPVAGLLVGVVDL